MGVLQGLTVEQLNGTTHWQIGSAAELEAKWPQIRRLRGDILKVVLGGSEDFPANRGTPLSGLDPALLPAVVRRAHREGLPVAAHILTAADFRLAVRAGVDQLAHPPLAGITRDDAALAARRGVPVMTTCAALAMVPPELIPPDQRRAALEGLPATLRLLRAAGVRLLIGSDNPRDSSAGEVAYLRRMGMFSGAELLRMWTVDTPAAIFPKRRLGRFEDGWEASFLALEGDPLADWSATRRIRLRVKQGTILGAAAG